MIISHQILTGTLKTTYLRTCNSNWTVFSVSFSLGTVNRRPAYVYKQKNPNNKTSYIWFCFIFQNRDDNKDSQQRSPAFQLLFDKWNEKSEITVGLCFHIISCSMLSLVENKLGKKAWLSYTKAQEVIKAKNHMWVFLALTLVPDFMGFPRSHSR